MKSETVNKISFTLTNILPQPLKDLFKNTARKARKWNKYTRIIEHSYLGENIKLVNADSLSAGWYGRDWPPDERPEFFFLKELNLSQKATILNIGAHQGLIALLLKRTLAPSGKVIAVEIDRLNAKACKENFSLNQDGHAISVHAAVSNVDGKVLCAGRSNARINNVNTILKYLYPTVNSVTIDELTKKYGVPELIYMDIEGAEVLALEGAKKSLGRVRVWFVEMHGDELCGAYGGTNAEVAKSLSQAGYRLWLSKNEDKRFIEIREYGDVPKERCFLIAECCEGRTTV